MTSMVHEEKFHASFGARWVRDLVSDAAYQRLCDAGGMAYSVRRWGNAELRAMYRKDIDEQIQALGLFVPPADRDREIL